MAEENKSKDIEKKLSDTENNSHYETPIIVHKHKHG